MRRDWELEQALKNKPEEQPISAFYDPAAMHNSLDKLLQKPDYVQIKKRQIEEKMARMPPDNRYLTPGRYQHVYQPQNNNELNQKSEFKKMQEASAEDFQMLNHEGVVPTDTLYRKTFNTHATHQSIPIKTARIAGSGTQRKKTTVNIKIKKGKK